jgi:hypothetical protein
MDLHIPFVLVVFALFVAPFLVAEWVARRREDNFTVALRVWLVMVVAGFVCWTLAGFLIGRH